MSSRILVVGSLAYDSVKTPLGAVVGALGGSANYFSVAASLFAPVSVVGVVGQDYAPKDVDVLKSRGVDVSGLQTLPGKTFHWQGEYDSNLNEAKTLKTELNVFADFKPQLSSMAQRAEYIFLANIDPVLQMEVLDQIEKPAFVAADTMNFWIQSKRTDLLKLLSRIDAVLLNESEALQLTGAANAIAAAPRLTELGVKTVIIKRGEYGFVAYQEGQFFTLPAYPIAEVVDPTGAGDTFAGGFMGYLAQMGSQKPQWSDVKKACVHGGLLASFTVEDFSLRRLLQVQKTSLDERWKSYLQIIDLGLSHKASF